MKENFPHNSQQDFAELAKVFGLSEDRTKLLEEFSVKLGIEPGNISAKWSSYEIFGAFVPALLKNRWHRMDLQTEAEVIGSFLKFGTDDDLNNLRLYVEKIEKRLKRGKSKKNVATAEVSEGAEANLNKETDSERSTTPTKSPWPVGQPTSATIYEPTKRRANGGMQAQQHLMVGDIPSIITLTSGLGDQKQNEPPLTLNFRQNQPDFAEEGTALQPEGIKESPPEDKNPESDRDNQPEELDGPDPYSLRERIKRKLREVFAPPQLTDLPLVGEPLAAVRERQRLIDQFRRAVEAENANKISSARDDISHWNSDHGLMRIEVDTYRFSIIGELIEKIAGTPVGKKRALLKEIRAYASAKNDGSSNLSAQELDKHLSELESYKEQLDNSRLSTLAKTALASLGGYGFGLLLEQLQRTYGLPTGRTERRVLLAASASSWYGLIALAHLRTTEQSERSQGLTREVLKKLGLALSEALSQSDAVNAFLLGFGAEVAFGSQVESLNKQLSSGIHFENPLGHVMDQQRADAEATATAEHQAFEATSTALFSKYVTPTATENIPDFIHQNHHPDPSHTATVESHPTAVLTATEHPRMSATPIPDTSSNHATSTPTTVEPTPQATQHPATPPRGLFSSFMDTLKEWRENFSKSTPQEPTHKSSDSHSSDTMDPKANGGPDFEERPYPDENRVAGESTGLHNHGEQSLSGEQVPFYHTVSGVDTGLLHIAQQEFPGEALSGAYYDQSGRLIQENSHLLEIFVANKMEFMNAANQSEVELLADFVERELAAGHQVSLSKLETMHLNESTGRTLLDVFWDATRGQPPVGTKLIIPGK